MRHLLGQKHVALPSKSPAQNTVVEPSVLEGGMSSNDADATPSEDEGRPSPVVGLKGLKYAPCKAAAEGGPAAEPKAEGGLAPTSTSQMDSPGDNDPIFEVDIDNFTTWSPMTIDAIDYRKCKFLIEEHITALRSYFALAMILWYKQDKRLETRQLFGCLGSA